MSHSKKTSRKKAGSPSKSAAKQSGKSKPRQVSVGGPPTVDLSGGQSTKYLSAHDALKAALAKPISAQEHVERILRQSEMMRKQIDAIVNPVAMRMDAIQQVAVQAAHPVEQMRKQIDAIVNPVAMRMDAIQQVAVQAAHPLEQMRKRMDASVSRFEVGQRFADDTAASFAPSLHHTARIPLRFDMHAREAEHCTETQQTCILLQEVGMEPAADELRTAENLLDEEAYARAFRSDIMAVEFVAGTIVGGGTLPKLLDKLQARGLLQPHFVEIAKIIYARSNRVALVRHANPGNEIIGKNEAVLLHRMCVAICEHIVKQLTDRETWRH